MVRSRNRILSCMKRTGSPLFSVCGLVALLFCLASGLPAGPRGFVIAEDRAPEQRVVQGKVVDGSNAVLSGAVVYLKDGHSLSVKSYITPADGTYRFGQLSQTTDYELWAESNGKKSGVRTISSFDSKNLFFIDLKVK